MGTAICLISTKPPINFYNNSRNKMITEKLLEPNEENFLMVLAKHSIFSGVHPGAMIFPFTTGEDYENLCRGIEEHGQMESIKVTPEGLWLVIKH